MYINMIRINNQKARHIYILPQVLWGNVYKKKEEDELHASENPSIRIDVLSVKYKRLYTKRRAKGMRGEIRHITIHKFERQRWAERRHLSKLGNSYYGQLKVEGGERKAEKTEKTTEEKKEAEEEEVRAENTEKTTEEDEEVNPANMEKTSEED